jgi:magnesium transporter
MPTDERQSEWIAHLRDVLECGDAALLREVVEAAHAADLAEAYPELDEDERRVLLDALDDEHTAELLAELESEEQHELLDELPVERVSDVLDEMASDDAADLLADLPTQEVDALLEHMEPERADEVAALLRYDEDTAGGLMATEFVRVGPDDSAETVLADLRRHAGDAEMIYILYVLDDDDRLLGIVNLRALIVCAPDTPMTELMHREVDSVRVDTPQEQVAALVRRRDLLAVPVLDDEGRMHGIVTVDDVGEVVEEEAAEDLLEVSGSEDAEEVPRPWIAWRNWRSGLLALVGGVIISLLVWRLTSALTLSVDVIVLLPLLLVLSITASSQAALAIDTAFDDPVEHRYPGAILFRELQAGAAPAGIGGVLAGAVVFFIARGTHDALARAWAVAWPMFLALWLAALVGAVGVNVVRRRADHTGSSAHTAIVITALLLASGVYLALAR